MQMSAALLCKVYVVSALVAVLFSREWIQGPMQCVADVVDLQVHTSTTFAATAWGYESTHADCGQTVYLH